MYQPARTLKNTSVAKQSKPAAHNQQLDEDQTRALVRSSQKAYGVGGNNMAASAAAVNAAFVNQKGACGSEILDCGKDATRAWARVAVWLGPKNDPIKVAEDSVIIYFDDLREKIMWEWVANQQKFNNRGPAAEFVTLNEDGRPVPKFEKDTIDIAKLFFRTRYFAERTAITQARARAQKQLLGYDWQEDTEAAEERSEVRIFQKEERPQIPHTPEVPPSPHRTWASERRPVQAPAPAQAPPAQAPPKPPVAAPDPGRLIAEIENIVSQWPVDFDTYMMELENHQNKLFGNNIPLPSRSWDAVHAVHQLHSRSAMVCVRLHKKLVNLGNIDPERAWEDADRILKNLGMFDPRRSKEQVDEILKTVNQLGPNDIARMLGRGENNNPDAEPAEQAAPAEHLTDDDMIRLFEDEVPETSEA